ncbi:MAG: hypothetical protein AAGG51_04785 [Cyanobacteria bacterium P01_G01_bin.54]
MRNAIVSLNRNSRYFEFYRRADVNRRFFFKLIHGVELPQTDNAPQTLELKTAHSDPFFEKRLLSLIKWLSLAIAGLFLFLVLHTA